MHICLVSQDWQAHFAYYLEIGHLVGIKSSHFVLHTTRLILALEMSFFLSCIRSFLEFQKANKKEKKEKKNQLYSFNHRFLRHAEVFAMINSWC